MQLLEKEKRLSESILWQLQCNAYTQFGPKAWSQKGVPFYVTSNPFTASSYAQIVFGFLKDVTLHFDKPLYILDLGAGTGRFAYLFLKEFLLLLENSHLKDLQIKYILTDIVSDNFAFWKGHPLLAKYFKKGILDYCYYHHAQTEPLKLAYRNVVTEVGNPLVLIANYFFDTIPQDLFRVNGGVLEEGLVTLYTTKRYEKNDDPAIINDLSWEFTFVPVDNLYARAPDFRELLLRYIQNLQNATFLFPVGALQSLNYFKKLSNKNMLLLAGDQGVATTEQTEIWEPKLALHGSFSIAVSYHILSHYFEGADGLSLLSQMPDPAFVTMAGVLNPKKQLFYATKQAFYNFIDAFEPQDYWRLGMEMEKSSQSLEAILLLVKLGKFDPMNIYGFYDVIRKELPFVSQSLKKRLSYILKRVADNFFPVGVEDGSFLANIGVLSFEIGEYVQALEFFKMASIYEGDKEYLIKNIKACMAKLKG